jgi:hypothetical protein
VRASLAAAVVAFMMWGPFYRQALHGTNEFWRPWDMFDNGKTFVCDVRWSQGSGTAARPLDPFATFHTEETPVAPRWMFIQRDRDSVLAVGARLCMTLGHHADVHAVASCPGQSGWDVALDGSERLCDPDFNSFMPRPMHSSSDSSGGGHSNGGHQNHPKNHHKKPASATQSSLPPNAPASTHVGAGR